MFANSVQNVKHDSKRFLFTVESAAAAEKRPFFAISVKVSGKFFIWQK
jgi:hypothetical protein